MSRAFVWRTKRYWIDRNMLDWANSSAKNGNVTFTACSANGKPVQLRLENVRIVWEPSAYGGDGSENRLSICFTASADVIQSVQAMEQVLGGSVLCSCIKDGNIKCKVSMDKVRVFDATRNRVQIPDAWRGWNVNAIVTVRGMWATRTQTGLCLETTDIQLLQPASEPACPF